MSKIYFSVNINEKIRKEKFKDKKVNGKYSNHKKFHNEECNRSKETYKNPYRKTHQSIRTCSESVKFLYE
jgi:1-acyl-sn-glycerol-3-phosphate acyltransferase